MASSVITAPSNEAVLDLQRFFTGALGTSLHAAQGCGKFEQASPSTPIRRILPVLDSTISLKPADFRREVLCYVLDVGGSYIRSHRVSLLNQEVEVHEERINVDENSQNINLRNENTPACQFWDTVARTVQTLVKTHDDENSATKPFNVACVVAFPLEQSKINVAKISWLSKGFSTGNATGDKLVGADVKTSVEKALLQRNIHANVSIVCNDSVASLAAGDFAAGPTTDCLVAAIVGSGVNICYREAAAEEIGYIGNLINTEVGQLPLSAANAVPVGLTDVDFQLAKLLGYEWPKFEFLLAGQYLSELCRLLVVRNFPNAPEAVKTESSINTEECCLVLEGTTARAIEVLQITWGWTATEEDIKKLQELFEPVFIRAGRFLGAAISACVTRASFGLPATRPVAVCLSGSVVLNSRKYQKEVRHTAKLLTPHRTIKLNLNKDATCVGAARLASPLFVED